MKKLYIPTSTLNFNNILSSESISPKAFYAIRGFGYSRWQEVEENNQENVVLLYDKPFSFTRPASDVEDHPMLVEITIDKDYPALTSGVYYSSESIYLSPWRTRFIFFTEQDKRVALSISDSSLETKMLGLYHRQLYVKNHSKVKHKPMACNVPLNKAAVDFDIRVNKMKGLLYGYYIGALLSTTPELAERANTLQEIQNVFSSILSSDSRKPTILQRQKLTSYFESMKKYDPIVSYLKNVAKENIKVEDVVSGLEKLGVVFPTMLDGERIISSLEFATDEYNPAYDWLKKEKESLRHQEKEECQYLDTSSEEIKLSDNALSKINNSHVSEEKEQQLMKAWVNEIFSSPEYNGKITTFAEVLSDVVTKKAKEVYADGWDDSRAKTELNQMRRYVRAQESSINWQNDLFSAIAAVLAKGSDWEQLRSFMQSKLISDYRIPFAFYGELNGFANLTRDFTDNLFGLFDKRYVASVYCELYRQLMGEVPTIGKTLPEDVLVERNFSKEREISVQQNIIQSPATDDYALHIWQQEIKRFANQEAIKKDKKRLNASLEQVLVENGKNTDYFKFITMLYKYDGWTPTGKGPNAAWKRMQEHFVPDYYYRVGGRQAKPTNSNAQKSSSLSLFDFSQNEIREAPSGPICFFEDDNAWNHIEGIVPEKDREKLHNDLIWFQSQIRKPKNERYKYYQTLDERNNELIIDKFCHLKEMPDKNGRVQAPYFTASLRDKIRVILNRIYCN